MANFCLKSGDFFQKLIFGGAEVAILNENVAIFRIFHLATLVGRPNPNRPDWSVDLDELLKDLNM